MRHNDCPWREWPCPAAAVPAPADRRGILGKLTLAEGFALAGYERVERVEERGQFAVRGRPADSQGRLHASPGAVEECACHEHP